MKKITLALTAFVSFCATSVAFSAAFNNDEVQVLRQSKLQMISWQNLPRQGQVLNQTVESTRGTFETAGVWSGSYWPLYKGGISDRWQQSIYSKSTDYRSFIYQIPTYDQIASMTPEQKNQLSAAEKYDYVRGDRAMSLTHAERKQMLASVNRQTNSIPTWFGNCHGTAPASINEPTPLHPIQVDVNGSPRESVVFYPDDLKGLLSSSYAHTSASVIGLGDRCNIDFSGRPIRDWFTAKRTSGCDDTNPGAFHLILANRIAQNKSFVVEIESGAEIWNYAVFGYKVVGDQPIIGGAFRGISRRRVDLDLYYVDGGSQSIQHQSTPIKTKRLTYNVILNRATGEVIGGTWAIGGRVIDFMWIHDQPGIDRRGLINLNFVRGLVAQSRL